MQAGRIVLASWMKFSNDTSKVVSVEVGIDLCSRNAGVAQHFLNSTQIGSAFYQMGRKGVSEGMGADGFIQSNFFCKCLYKKEYVYTGQVSSVSVKKDKILTTFLYGDMYSHLIDVNI